MAPSQKPIGCNSCPLLSSGVGFAYDEVVDNPEVIFIGEALGETEAKTGKPFQGPAGFVMRSWLVRSVTQLQLLYERKKIYIGNTLRCMPPKNSQGRAYPSGKERLEAEACCRQYDEWQKTSAKTVVLFGEVPQRAFFSAELEREDATDRSLGRSAKGVMGRVGRVYEKAGRRWIFAPHPAFILRQPMLVTHGVEALKIAVGTTYVEPQTVPWQEAVQELMMQCVEVIA